MATATQGEVVAEQVMTFRAICPHGKVRIMVCDTINTRADKQAKRDLAAAVRDGFTIDKVTVEEARKSDMDCPECDAAYAAKKKRKRA